MNKKIFGLILSGMLCAGMVGCGDDVKEAAEQGYNDAKQDVEQVEDPKEESVEEEPEQEQHIVDNSNNVELAYEAIKPIIDQQFGSLDHEYIIMDGGLYLIGYLSSYEIYEGMSDGTWAELVSQAEYVSNNMKAALNEAGYTNVSFNISMCDNVKRQDLCFLLVRDGITYFNIAN